MDFDSVNIRNLATSCMFKPEEFKNLEYFTNNQITVTGISIKACFDKKKIDEKRDIIIKLIDSIPGIEEGVSLLSLSDKNSKVSTYSCELLMCLGVASGEIDYMYPRDMWDSLPNGFPFVVRTKKEKEIQLVKN